MRFSRAVLFLSLSILATLASPHHPPNEIHDRAIGAGAGGEGGAGHTNQRFPTVLNTADHLGLTTGKYAFYAIYSTLGEKLGAEHEDLSRLTETIGGLHYSLIVGQLAPRGFKGREVGITFSEGLSKQNGKGQSLNIENDPYFEYKDIQFEYLGEVAQIGQEAIDLKVKQVFVDGYDVHLHNCKTFVDNLHASLQRSAGPVDSGPARGPARGQAIDIQGRGSSAPSPGICRCQ